MDQETLYTASKWQILKLLAEGPKSPIEISQIASLSLANVSQQLRLLEMAGLVTSERVPNREKGQPRLMYQLAGNSAYVISTSSNFVEKRRLDFSMTNKIVLKIWFLEDPELRALCEKAFWRVEECLPETRAILVDLHSTNPVSIYLVPKGERLPVEEIQQLRYQGASRPLTVTQSSVASLHEVKDEVALYPLYDPEGLFKKADCVVTDDDH